MKRDQLEPWVIHGSSSLQRLTRIMVLSRHSVDTRMKWEQLLHMVLHRWKQYTLVGNSNFSAEFLVKNLICFPPIFCWKLGGKPKTFSPLFQFEVKNSKES
jgi:hypothetical protein